MSALENLDAAVANLETVARAVRIPLNTSEVRQRMEDLKAELAEPAPVKATRVTDKSDAFVEKVEDPKA